MRKGKTKKTLSAQQKTKKKKNGKTRTKKENSELSENMIEIKSIIFKLRGPRRKLLSFLE